ncbi:MAG: AAA family ATPase [Bacteroidales bacterium]
MLRKIAITGPESTGKSTLSNQLASHYHCLWVPEFAREYLNNLNRSYGYDDILQIAKGQVKLENQAAAASSGFLFCDTEMTVCKIWCEFKYGRVHPWILKQLEKQRYDLYLLMDTDLPWQHDPLREHPDKRKQLFDLYRNELISHYRPFMIISGTGEERLQRAIEVVDNKFNLI